MTDKPNPVTPTEGVEAPRGPDDNLSLEALVLLLHTQRLKNLEDKSMNEFTELKKRQAQVRRLHELMKAINSNTNNNGEFSFSSDEIKQLVKEAKELGVAVDEGKTQYNKDERDRLMENVRMTIDDLNVQNEMQLQTINRLTNERYESYQMVRSTMKPIDDVKQRIAREVKG
jgi:hypothetical protein